MKSFLSFLAGFYLGGFALAVCVGLSFDATLDEAALRAAAWPVAVFDFLSIYLWG
jgi:hypothetical protein